MKCKTISVQAWHWSIVKLWGVQQHGVGLKRHGLSSTAPAARGLTWCLCFERGNHQHMLKCPSQKGKGEKRRAKVKNGIYLHPYMRARSSQMHHSPPLRLFVTSFLVLKIITEWYIVNCLFPSVMIELCAYFTSLGIFCLSFFFYVNAIDLKTSCPRFIYDLLINS